MASILKQFAEWATALKIEVVVQFFKSRSLWSYYSIYVAVTALTFVLVLFYARDLFRDFHLKELQQKVESQLTQQELATIEEELDSVVYSLSIVIIAAVLLIAALGFLLYRRINPPLEEMRLSAERYAKGDFSRTMKRYQIREIDAIGLSLNKMARQLDRLDKVRRDFIANVSHELKTPITSINGFVETLIEGAIDDKQDAMRFLQIIKKQSERLTDIIVDLLTLARLEDSRTKESLILENELLEGVIAEVIEVCRPRAQQQQIVLEGYTEDGLSAVIDRSLIIQALTNLVENAIKYSDDGSMIRITARAEGDEFISLAVEDQGPGISKQHLNRLFERFYRVDRARSRDQGGTGLGLAIVKHISQVHGGSVNVSSEIGVGSCFTIKLPRYRAV